MLGGWRALLKLCFQVFIVLSSADEAGICRMYEGAWGGARVSRVRVADCRRPRHFWEFKSQIAGLACQDTRYKGPVYQTARLT